MGCPRINQNQIPFRQSLSSWIWLFMYFSAAATGALFFALINIYKRGPFPLKRFSFNIYPLTPLHTVFVRENQEREAKMYAETGLMLPYLPQEIQQFDDFYSSQKPNGSLVVFFFFFSSILDSSHISIFGIFDGIIGCWSQLFWRCLICGFYLDLTEVSSNSSLV